MTGKPLKVCVQNRKTRKGVVSDDFHKFLLICREKFTISNEADIRVVLDEDGTEVDTFYFDTLEPNTKLMILQVDETWEPESGTSGVQPFNETERDRIFRICEKIKKRKTVETSKSEVSQNDSSKTCVSVLVGWRHFSFEGKGYRLIKSSKHHPKCGPRLLSLDKNCSYDECLNIFQKEFFPRGKSMKGKLEHMTCGIGNANSEAIPNLPDVTVENMIDSLTTLKPRLYLLTKQKEIIVPDSSDSDSDDLPDLSISSSAAATTSIYRPQARFSCPPAGPTFPTLSSLSQSVLTTSPWSFASQAPPVSTVSAIPTSSLSVSSMPSFSSNSDSTGPLPGADVRSPSCTTSSQTQWIATGTPTVAFKDPVATVCNICCERQKTSFLFPCGHTFCTVCAVHMDGTGKRCASCRQTVERVCSLFN